MATIVERIRQVVSAEDDDFFNAETILYYANKSQNKVVSYMTQQELRPTIRTQEGVIPGQEKSLRALDGLRKIHTVTVDPSQFELVGDNYKGNVPFPEDMKQKLYLHYHERTPIRELTSQKIHFLSWGNLKPTIFESYYYVTNENGEKVFQIYLPEDAEGNDIKIYYVSTPTEIQMMDEELTELPEQLENAVIYGAAVMMLGQESVKDPEGNAQVIMQIYQEELQNNVY